MPRATMGLLKGLLRARNLLLVIFVPLLLLPLPVLHPSSVSTARPLLSLQAGRRARGQGGQGGRGMGCRAAPPQALLPGSRHGQVFLGEAPMLSFPTLLFSSLRPPPGAPDRVAPQPGVRLAGWLNQLRGATPASGRRNGAGATRCAPEQRDTLLGRHLSRTQLGHHVTSSL